MSLRSEVRLVFEEAFFSVGVRFQQFWRKKVALAEHQKSERIFLSREQFSSEDAYREAEANHYIDREYVKVLLTSQIHADCRKYGISLPDPYEYQEFSNSKMLYLKDGPMLALQASIRAAKKERSQELRAWAAVMVGLIGSITGLVAVLTTS